MMEESNALQTHVRALAPHDEPPTLTQLCKRAVLAALILGGAGVVVAVVVLLIGEMPDILLEGMAVGALFGAGFGVLFALIGGLLRRAAPNRDIGRETTPAFLGAMVGAGLMVRLAFGGTALAVTLFVFWGVLGVVAIASMLYHEFETTPHP